MIKLFRIDDRILHGQVAFSWTRTLNIDTIYVVNDVIVKDEISRMTLSIAKPMMTKLEVLSLADGIEKIKKRAKDRTRTMIIINNFNDALAICQAVPEIKELNVGGLKENPNKESHRYTGNVTLTMEDIETAKQIRDLGVTMIIKAVPEEKGTELNKLLPE
jgi:mannose/fructose/N-acetylgalactosamine-specific phosphotransferase system component IIB